MNSYHSQPHGLEKVMVTEAVVAFGPSDICCSPSLFGASMVMADGWN